MLDRDGRVRVDTYPSFSLLLMLDNPDEVKRDLPQVAEGLGIRLEELQAQIDESGSLPRFQPIVIKYEASDADIAFVESHRADLPVLELLMVHRRRYPRDGFLAHAIGYVGGASENSIAASGYQLVPVGSLG